MQSFNVAGQGPFFVMIEDISSRNGLLPLSNVHPLSVTDLLQREYCCCYKKEDMLKMKTHRRSTDQVTSKANLFQKLQALTIASCEDSESPSSSSEREPFVFLSRAAHRDHTSTSQLFRSSLFLLRPQNLT